jgi:hypothetical protein
MKAIKTNKNNYALLLTNDEVAQIMSIFGKLEIIKEKKNIEHEPMRGFKKPTRDFFLEIQKEWRDRPVFINDPKFVALRKKYFIFTYTTPVKTLVKRGHAILNIKDNGRMDSFMLTSTL